MWETYTYEISIATDEGRWRRAYHDEAVFSRKPKEIARSLLERWINDHQNNLPGGKILVCRRNLARDPTDITATIRVLVYRGGLNDHHALPDAAAYLGRSRKDFNPTLLAKRLRRRGIASTSA